MDMKQAKQADPLAQTQRIANVLKARPGLNDRQKLSFFEAVPKLLKEVPASQNTKKVEIGSFVETQISAFIRANVGTESAILAARVNNDLRLAMKTSKDLTNPSL